MAKVTIGFGVALLLLGIVGFVGTGSAHPTALIPAVFGVVLGVCGFLANSPDNRRRMIVMHVAVTAGLLGLLGAGGMAVAETMKGRDSAAVESQAAMAGLCLIYVGLCVRSFIAARRTRDAA